MISIKKNLFVLINFMIVWNSFDSFYLAQTKKHSIIKLFCINSFKEEMLKADIEYSEEIANETCECYLNELLKTSSHKIAIKKCKLEAKENF